MATPKPGSVKAGLINITDLLGLASNLNLVLTLVSSCYSLALQIAAKLGTALPKASMPKPGVRISVSSFVAMLKALEAVLQKVLAMLSTGEIKAGKKRSK